MRMSPVMLELIAKNITDIPPLKAGEILAARVLRIEGEMLLLLLSNKTVLHSKLVADVELRQGQEITLIVKNIKDGRIELTIASEQKPGLSNVENAPDKNNIQIRRESVPIAQKLMENTADKNNIQISRESIHIVEKLAENGLPVTAKTLDGIQRAVKHIVYLQDNMALIARNPIPAEWDVINTSLDQIVKWMVFVKEDTGQGYVETEKTIEQEKLLLLMEELTGSAPEDIIKLRKFGLKQTPYNLIMAKNLRENKGFLDILLKLFYGNRDREGRTDNRPAPQSPGWIKYEENGNKPGSKAFMTDNITVEDAKSEIKPIDITRLLESTLREGKDNPRLKAAAELLTQKTAFLNKSLASQNQCIFPFLFDGQVSECIIRRNKGNSKKSEQKPEVIELEIDTHLSFLGRIKALIRSSGKDIDCSFSVESEDTKELIEKNKHDLLKCIKKAGFRVTGLNCKKFSQETKKTVDKFVDLKV